LDLWRPLDALFVATKKKGPPPKFNTLDSLVIILIFYKSDLGFETLGALLEVKKTTLEDTISRIRPLLYTVLQNKWLGNLPRPKSLTGPLPHVALLLDSTTVEVFRPTGRFEEAKKYWDGHHGVYGLKKEVAIMPSKPHFALFIQKGRVGSIHDFEILKETQGSYHQYLTKTPQEAQALNQDPHLLWEWHVILVTKAQPRQLL